MWGPGELLVSRDSGRSDWSKCWFGVIRRLIIRRRQARVSVNVPEGALAAFESGPLDPTFLLEVSRSELPIHLEVSSFTAPACRHRSPSRCQSRGGTRARLGGPFLCGQPASDFPYLSQPSGPTLGIQRGAGVGRGCGAGIEALGLRVACG